jgi:hypothetical protein
MVSAYSRLESSELARNLSRKKWEKFSGSCLEFVNKVRCKIQSGPLFAALTLNNLCSLPCPNMLTVWQSILGWNQPWICFLPPVSGFSTQDRTNTSTVQTRSGDELQTRPTLLCLLVFKILPRVCGVLGSPDVHLFFLGCPTKLSSYRKNRN